MSPGGSVMTPGGERALEKENRMRTCVLSLCTLLSFTCRAGAGDDVFLLSYFESNGETGVFLAASEDGRTFKDLNDRRAVFTPPAWQGQNLTRDPAILFRYDVFHMG